MHSLRIALCADTSFAESALHWVALDSANSILDSGTGHPGRWADTRLIELMLPARNVLLAPLPAAIVSRRQLGRILPFSLEEQTLTAPEHCHIAASEVRGGNPAIALVARDGFARILARLAEAGVAARRAYSLAHCLPLVDGEWHGYISSSEGYVRTGSGGFSFDPDATAVPAELQLALRAPGAPQQLVLHLAADVAADSLQRWAQDLPCALRTVADWDWRTAVLADNPVNLLQGAFGPAAEFAFDWRQYRLPLVLAGVASCLYLAGVLGDYWSLARQYKAASSAVEQETRKVIPAGPLIDPLAQLQRKLQDSRQAGGAGMLATTQRLAPLLAPLQLAGLRYAAGELVLLVRVGDAPQMDALLQRLQSAGMKAERKALTPQDGAFVAEIVLRSVP